MRYARRYADSKRGAKKTRAFDVKLQTSSFTCREQLSGSRRGGWRMFLVRAERTQSQRLPSRHNREEAPLPNRAKSFDRAQKKLRRLKGNSRRAQGLGPAAKRGGAFGRV
jgi:hypothetical protein